MKTIARCLALLPLLPALSLSAPPPDLFSDTWAATDGLGRAVPLASEVGPVRSNRTTGIFYFLWHGPNWKAGPFDIAKIFAADPDAMKKPDSPLWGPMGQPHYWGEPLFGYYRSDDPWVLRKHAQMLANAGIDTLIFDTTNAEIYRETFLKLCEVFAQARRDGVPAPQICFMVNTKAGATTRRIYEALYKPGLHRELWFHWQGRPLLICDPKEADAELKSFFTLRRAHWPFEMRNTQDAWHWEATYPQPYGYSNDPGQPEQVNVSVAQNLRAADGKVTNMSAGDARGRDFHGGRQEASRAAIDRGANFAEQWERAFALDPPFVMVTGWNEWIAGRFGHAGPLTFVDQFDERFSRDIEPMRGGHEDHYYYQLVAGVRRYKGARAVAPVVSRPIVIDGNFSDWEGVKPEFRDAAGDTLHRAFPGVASSGVYSNDTGRNDIVLARVSVDNTHVYFHVRAATAFAPRPAPDWLTLLIDADCRVETGWMGYEHVVEPAARTAGIGECDLELAVPRALLGLRRLPAEIRFKWIDNIRHGGDAAEFTLRGDAAPDDRFSYCARLEAAAATD